jgi:uncharacterized protein
VHKVQQAQAVDPAEMKAMVDYTTLMERSFGEALHEQEDDKPPVPVDPSQYLAKEEPKE